MLPTVELKKRVIAWHKNTLLLEGSFVIQNNSGQRILDKILTTSIAVIRYVGIGQSAVLPYMVCKNCICIDVHYITMLHNVLFKKIFFNTNV